MVAGPLDDGVHTAVADGEPLAGRPVEVGLALRGAIQRGVPDQDRLFRDEGGALGGIHNDPPAAQALAQIVIGLALEFQRHASGQEGPERLAGRPRKLDVDGVRRQAFQAIASGDLTGQDRPHRPVHVPDGQLQFHGSFVLDGRLAQLDQLPIEDSL